MAYQIMIVADDGDQLDEIIHAWADLHLELGAQLDCVRVWRRPSERRHIPMRYGFEQLDRLGVQAAVALFAVAPDHEIAERCVTSADETLLQIGGSEAAYAVAWPLTIARQIGRTAPQGKGQ
ncbi:MAG: hypothetical protein GXY68_12125 [Chloroflexi bacterium]|mgnify:CR=1 FL=1|jgi:hypothetical protein|nr:hypothetical protein [Chloroflexota bacterium]